MEQQDTARLKAVGGQSVQEKSIHKEINKGEQTHKSREHSRQDQGIKTEFGH